MTAAAATQDKPDRRGQPGWLRGLGCGVLIALNPASGLLLAVLLSPSVLMRVLDREPDRLSSRAVFLSNLAGAVGAVVALWRDGVPTLAAALELLSVPSTIAIAWLAAAGGWLGAELLSQLALAWLTAAARHEMRDVAASVDELVAEWGEPAPAEKPGKPA